MSVKVNLSPIEQKEVLHWMSGLNEFNLLRETRRMVRDRPFVRHPIAVLLSAHVDDLRNN